MLCATSVNGYVVGGNHFVFLCLNELRQIGQAAPVEEASCARWSDVPGRDMRAAYSILLRWWSLLLLHGPSKFGKEEATTAKINGWKNPVPLWKPTPLLEEYPRKQQGIGDSIPVELR